MARKKKDSVSDKTPAKEDSLAAVLVKISDLKMRVSEMNKEASEVKADLKYCLNH